MSISNINRVQLAYIAETTFGTQKTGSNLQILRITSESFKQNTEIALSNEIRSDRQRADVVRTKVNVSGGFGFELSYASFDDFLVAALMSSDWSSLVTVGPAATISAASADNSLSDSGSGFGSLVANQWIKTSGFTNAANNGYFKIVSATAAKIVVSGGTLTNENAGQSVTIRMGPQIVNGTTDTSFNIERTYSDLSNELALFTGCTVSQCSLNVATNGILTGNFDFLGKAETSETESGGSGYDAVNTNPLMNSIDHVVGIYENQTSIDVIDFSLTLSNNLRELMKVGHLGTIDISAGAVDVSGSFNAYYESKTLYDKYLTFTTTSLAKVVEDEDGNAYVIDLPEVKVTDSGRHAGEGGGNDFKTPCTFQAFRDSSEDVTIRIAKFAA